MSYYTAKTLIAGKPGTDKWVKKYGDALVCVRYKYDLQNGRKIKTVELIVENQPWNKNNSRIPANKIVGIRVKYGEINVARLVRNAGGVWNKAKKLWQLPYLEAMNLGLEDRIEPL
jgi:hypothetical protein